MVGGAQRRAAAGSRPPCMRSQRYIIALLYYIVALQLIAQCALVESQATNFANAGRESYTQPESQGGVLTNTFNGPPYRDAADAVRSRAGTTNLAALSLRTPLRCLMCLLCLLC